MKKVKIHMEVTFVYAIYIAKVNTLLINLDWDGKDDTIHRVDF